MVTSTSLKEQFQAKVTELEQAASTIDEEQATRSPAPGEWSAKELMSHLAGETPDHDYGMRLFLEQDTPELLIERGVSFYTDDRKNASFADLRSGVIEHYSRLADWIGQLDEQQLNRKAHIPLLKETPIGEYPTLEQWIGAISGFHIADHVQQLQRLAS